MFFEPINAILITNCIFVQFISLCEWFTEIIFYNIIFVDKSLFYVGDLDKVVLGAYFKIYACVLHTFESVAVVIVRCLRGIR